MASSLLWLRTCKLSQLRALAVATGINSSGTKTLLTTQLLSHLPNGHFNPNNTKPRNHATNKDPLNIISIDMGIRNLAYCRILLPQSQSPPSKSKSTPSIPTTLGPPTLTEWTRIAISPRTLPSSPPSKAPKEPFDPPTYSHHAYTLVRTLLSPSPAPTHILIERQRYRSMGGASVQEWTLRVNMFEAMIYAVLNSFREMGRWEGEVQGVAPGRVSKFWLDGVEADEGEDGMGVAEGMGKQKRVSKGEKSKAGKIAVVEGWLGMEDGERGFGLEGGAEEMGRRFLRKRRGGKRVRVGEKVVGGEGGGGGEVEIGKLDDLADCLLQGMAWVQWERNRRLVMEKGVQALDEFGKE